jgi:hypothetical protein
MSSHTSPSPAARQHACPYTRSKGRTPEVPGIQTLGKEGGRPEALLTIAIFDPFSSVFPNGLATTPSSVTWLSERRGRARRGNESAAGRQGSSDERGERETGLGSNQKLTIPSRHLTPCLEERKVHKPSHSPSIPYTFFNYSLT